MKIISFGILLAGILLIRKAAWNYISRRTQYFLWIFAAFFLLLGSFLNIPSKFSLENSVYSIFYYIEQNGTGNDAEETKKALPDASKAPYLPLEAAADFQTQNTGTEGYKEVNASEHISQSMPEQAAGKNNPTDGKADGRTDRKEQQQDIIKKNINGICMAGSVTAFLIIIISNIRFYILCKRNRIFKKKLNDSNLTIYSLKGISSPFLFGRNIYIDMETIQSEKNLRHIIIHEYCHFRHKDNLWALLRTLCLALNWYNPFAWLANEYVKRDCELACDEAALSFLDGEEKTEYGYTLLTLVKRSGGKTLFPTAAAATIATTMSGNMKRMKERISMIHSTKKHYAFAAWLIIICMIFLTGCTFTRGDSAAASQANRVTADEPVQHPVKTIKETTVMPPEETEVKTSEVKASEVKASEVKASEVTTSETDPNKYYNVSAVYDDGKTYLSSADGLYSIADGSDKRELIYSAPVTLGSIAEGYLFFYAYPADIKEAAIMSVELSTGRISASLPLGERIYDFREMCCESGELYINTAMGKNVAVFTILPDGSLEEKELLPITIPDELEEKESSVLALSPVISSEEGYKGTFYMTKEKGEEYDNCLYYYEDHSQIYKLEGITDAMITSKGIIGRDINRYNDVYLWDIYTGEKHLLYSSDENNDKYFGYNTYDEKGLYGLVKENDTSYYISRVNWDGSLNNLLLLENISDSQYGINAHMSVIRDCLYYYNPQTDKMECYHLRNN